MSALDHLKRSWWFPGIAGYRPAPTKHQTYSRYELDSQPRIERLTGDLSWLQNEAPASTWAVTQDDDGNHTQVLSPHRLRELNQRNLVIDPAFIVFVEDSSLQSKIRSCTGCYLDLGDFMPHDDQREATFLHFLSDQQWTKHWLLYCPAKSTPAAVIIADHPYGFDVTEWGGVTPPGSITLDGSSDVEVCADSFEEFLYRFWVENELYFSSVEDHDPSSALIQDYAARLQAN